MSRLVSFFVLIGIIAVIGVMFYRVMAGFFVPLFLAGILVVIFQPLHRWLLRRLRGRDTLAALTTTAAMMMAVLAPVTILFVMGLAEGAGVVSQLDVAGLEQKLGKLRNRLGLEMPFASELRKMESGLQQLQQPPQGASMDMAETLTAGLKNRAGWIKQHWKETDQPVVYIDSLGLTLENLETLAAERPRDEVQYDEALQKASKQLREMKEAIAGGPYQVWLKDAVNPSPQKLRETRAALFETGRRWLVSLGGATTALAIRLLFGMAIVVVAFYFFLLDGPKMVKALMRLSPLDDRYERELLLDFEQLSRAVVAATLLSAVAQGLLAGVGFWFAGLNAVIFLTMLTTVLAMVPFIGAGAVWIPAALWLYFYEDNLAAAIGLGIYGAAIISMADNIIKPMVLHGRARLHPLFAFLSVLGGVQALGPIGILVGPMVVALLQTLLNILQRELSNMEQFRATL